MAMDKGFFKVGMVDSKECMDKGCVKVVPIDMLGEEMMDATPEGRQKLREMQKTGAMPVADMDEDMNEDKMVKQVKRKK